MSSDLRLESAMTIVKAKIIIGKNMSASIFLNGKN